jgi:hypothetical protein
MANRLATSRLVSEVHATGPDNPELAKNSALPQGECTSSSTAPAVANNRPPRQPDAACFEKNFFDRARRSRAFHRTIAWLPLNPLTSLLRHASLWASLISFSSSSAQTYAAESALNPAKDKRYCSRVVNSHSTPASPTDEEPMKTISPIALLIASAIPS